MFNFFKKKRTIQDKSWKDITVAKYYQIVELLKEQDDYTAMNLIDVIWEVDSFSMPATEANLYAAKLSFLTKDIDNVIPKKHYRLNNTKYDSNCDLTVMSTAQFVDYQNYIKNNRIEEILSVFFVPDGHEYNDGYDIKQVQKDLLMLPITDAYAIAFFFATQFKLYCNRFRGCLIKSMKKAKMSKTVINQFKQVDLFSLVSYPSFLNFVNQQTKH